MIPNIEDLKGPPVVGKFYMVPCVVVERETIELGVPVGAYPVQGPMHTDVEHIGFEPSHWHYDARFLSAKQWLWKAGRPRRQVIRLGETTERLAAIAVFGAPLCDRNRSLSRPVPMKRQCMRDMPPVPFLALREKPSFWLKELEAAYADKRVTCGKCPHRGLPLESLPREPGTDNVVCPGHGLRWDLKTGQLVR